MKKNILILLGILAGAICCILLLVQRSAPQKLVLDISRNYNGIKVIGEDTIAFPGIINFMQTDGKRIYGYSNRKKALYCFDPDTRSIDTLLHTDNLFASLPGSVDRDPATNYFYLLDASTNRIYAFHPGNPHLDTLNGDTHRATHGEKCSADSSFLITSIDFIHNVTTLRKANYIRHMDTTIYTFAQYQDAGISADGFFSKSPSSHRIFYIPYYNSEIIQYDEMGQHISKIISIDKTPSFNASIPTGDGYTVSGKALLINLAAACDSTHLFLLSGVSSRERNEPTGTVVDIYSILTGQYEHSLQFPNYKGMPVILLARTGDRLLVSFGSNIISYRIQQ